MAVKTKHLNVVWLKRDLRLRDHEPLMNACKNSNDPEQNGAVMLIYIVEPMLLADPHMDIRHWRFIWQSLQDLNSQLAAFNTKVWIFHGDAVQVLESLHQHWPKLTLFSHQEVGLANTFERDKQVKAWADQHHITWHESEYAAVTRALKDRQTWQKVWYQRMRAAAFDVELDQVAWLPQSECSQAMLPTYRIPQDWQDSDAAFQQGGECRAWHALHNFFEQRGKDYHWAISKPEASRRACSRISPYLAWGNISLKQMYQTLLSHWDRKGWRRALSALSSRLHWHCHFIQKFESEYQMEFQPVNRGYLDFPYREDGEASDFLEKWQQGMTGIPLVDACMRCLVRTGYLNFRMRAMLVSFLVHHLNIDWRAGVTYLGRMFLDFEPGMLI